MMCAQSAAGTVPWCGHGEAREGQVAPRINFKHIKHISTVFVIH